MTKLFSLEEAQALLSSLLPSVERLRDLALELKACRESVLSYHQRARGNGKDAPAGELESKQREAQQIETQIRRELSSITEQGVEVKDLEMGLLDFPSLRDGRVVYLCWKLGEPSIAFWHPLETGYASREPL